ncbi:hypothetical protein ABW20_dc0103966 [Dactylellina cionopaga]|nr:hypothetical protein ABW20_dc0103966 [Dactylellina cionopaga]
MDSTTHSAPDNSDAASFTTIRKPFEVWEAEFEDKMSENPFVVGEYSSSADSSAVEDSSSVKNSSSAGPSRPKARKEPDYFLDPFKEWAKIRTNPGRYIDPSFLKDLPEECPFYTDDEVNGDNRIDEIFGKGDDSPYFKVVKKQMGSVPTVSWSEIDNILTGKPIPEDREDILLSKPKDTDTDGGSEDGKEEGQPSNEQEDAAPIEEEPPNILEKWLGPPPSEWDVDVWPDSLRDLYNYIYDFRHIFRGDIDWRFVLLTLISVYVTGILLALLAWINIRASEMKKAYNDVHQT